MTGFGVASWLRSRLPSRRTLEKDAVAGVVLGVESVPDGLALGVLAGVNPLAGLYGYMFGTGAGALGTSTTLLTIQVSGATAIIVADAGLGRFADPQRALYMLSIMAGVMMIVAGLLRGGRLLRFVPRSVMIGFISGVGVNTVLGQLGNFTGFDASGSNRVLRALNLVLNFLQIDLSSFAVGALTLALIVILQRTRLGALGLVVAIVVGSGLAVALNAYGSEVAMVGDIAAVDGGLPTPVLPDFGAIPELLVPALAIAFIGMVQGAGVAAAFPNPDGSPSNASRDFIGQGIGSVISGLFRGMPASGSMSATALTAQAGARSRVALFVAAGVMAVVILALGDLVGYVAFPALAALLIVVGFGTIRPAQIMISVRSGLLQAVVLGSTFVLTMIIPVQFAVLAGVALAVVLFVVEQSGKLALRRLEIDARHHIRELDPPKEVGVGEVLVLQPYGNLFFASASAFGDLLPTVTPLTRRSVVILRLRGIDELGSTVTQVLTGYAAELTARDSRLMINGGPALREQIGRSGLLAVIGPDGFVASGEWQGRGVAKADATARTWIAEVVAEPGDPEGPGTPGSAPTEP